jgi:hypothetical protein
VTTTVNLAPEIRAAVTGAADAGRKLERYARRVIAKLPHTTRHYGALLQADVRSRARSLFQVTDYDSSIQLQVKGGLRPQAEVGTDQPHGYRLEQGMVGRDSLGRFEQQRPRPHFAPAAAAMAARYKQAVTLLVKP